MSTLAERHSKVLDRIAAAARRAGRDPAPVRLVAVSKGRALEAVMALHALGQRDFGENRVEEAGAKITGASGLAPGPTWHMIGHVQRRKAREVAVDFDWVHSLDGAPLAERLSRAAGEKRAILPVLLECNVSGEANKYGLPADRVDSDPAQWQALCAVVEGILAQPNLRVEGLMTMAPVVPEPNLARPVFQQLRRLRDRLAGQFGASAWRELSMGMTDDYEVAVEEGATLVRIGRAIFEPLADV
jgi:pyridoxal phosphate enzyme (YggS family)